MRRLSVIESNMKLLLEIFTYTAMKERLSCIITIETVKCIMHCRSTICIITIKNVTHIFAAETVTCICAAETSNSITSTETVTCTIAEKSTNIPVTKSIISRSA